MAKRRAFVPSGLAPAGPKPGKNTINKSSTGKNTVPAKSPKSFGPVPARNPKP